MTEAKALKSMPFDSHEIYDESTGTTAFDRVAYSKDLADWMRNYFSNGILIKGANVISNELEVTHTGALNLSVNAGEIVINGRTGFVEAPTELTLDVGGSADRIDRIVMELNLTDRYIYLKILKGAETSEPVAPELTQTEDLYQIPLASVRVNAGTAVVASVTDERQAYISNVTIGIEKPSANSAEVISVSPEVTSMTGANNVDAALQNIAVEMDDIPKYELIASGTVHLTAKNQVARIEPIAKEVIEEYDEIGVELEYTNVSMSTTGASNAAGIQIRVYAASSAGNINAGENIDSIAVSGKTTPVTVPNMRDYWLKYVVSKRPYYYSADAEVKEFVILQRMHEQAARIIALTNESNRNSLIVYITATDYVATVDATANIKVYGMKYKKVGE